MPYKVISPAPGTPSVGKKYRKVEPTDSGGLMGDIRAFTGAGIEGVPIAGPYIRQGADWLRAKIHGGTPEEQSKETERLQAANPYADLAGSVTGGVAGSLPMIAAAPAAFGVTGSLAARTAASTLSGAGVSAVDALARGENPYEAGALGAGLGLVSPMLGQGASRAYQNITGKGAPLTTKGLENLGGQLYKQAENVGLVVKPQAINRGVQSIANMAWQSRINTTLHPKASAVMREIQSVRGQQMDLGQIDQLRQIALDGLSSNDAADRRMSGLIVGKLDDFMEGLTVADVSSGNPKEANRLIKEARSLWKRKSKSEILDRAFKKAENRRHTIGFEYGIRDSFRSISENEKLFRRFSKDEQAAILAVVRGGPVSNSMRFLGRLAPKGPIGATLGVFTGSSIAGPAGAVALPLGAAGAKGGASLMAASRAKIAHELVRRGAPAPTNPNIKALVQALSMRSGPKLEDEFGPRLKEFGGF